MWLPLSPLLPSSFVAFFRSRCHAIGYTCMDFTLPCHIYTSLCRCLSLSHVVTLPSGLVVRPPGFVVTLFSLAVTLPCHVATPFDGVVFFLCRVVTPPGFVVPPSGLVVTHLGFVVTLPCHVVTSFLSA